MPTSARTSFEANAADVGYLLDVHALLGGTEPGRRDAALQVLNRSGIVLVSAIWEAYVEDLAAEALRHMVGHAGSPDDLPASLRRGVASELKKDPHHESPWRLAGDGWRPVLIDRLTDLQEARNRTLNTPKAEPVDSLYEEAIGVGRLSDAWYWSGMSADQARAKLDEFVALRGDIAHRGVAAVRKKRVTDFLNHVTRLVGKTDASVNAFVRSACGSGIF
jgi:RiboL-PSP-HEPN